jgi:hypothetical protein
MNNMFVYFLNWFCSTKEIHKLLIRESYEEYNNLVSNFYKENPGYNGSYTLIDYDKMDKSTRKKWSEFKIKNHELIEIVINDLIAYTKNYPDEKISNNALFIENKDYPYRLQQNLKEIISEL